MNVIDAPPLYFREYTTMTNHGALDLTLALLSS
jgi:hypothetical protein